MPDIPTSNKKIIIAGAVGILLGFIIGFKLADSINKPELDSARAEVARLRGGVGAKESANGEERTAVKSGDEFPTLTDEQLKNAVTQADADPSNAELQHKVGQALYFYAWEKGNAQILPEVARILKRAHTLDPKNYRTTVIAGDAHFLIATQNGDAKTLGEARKFYETALAAQPDDAQVRTNLGRTHFFDKPSNPQRAISEYRRALQADPRQELSVQSLAAALIETGGLDEAARRLDELEKMNPSNTELPGLRAQLEQKRNAAKEKQ
jgi:tetratricopeptide (TPR) repeat protein